MEPIASNPQWFVTTHWSVILSTGESDPDKASASVEALCRTYWPPLYTFVRRLGYGPEDAQDLTQSFFAKLLEKNIWARADPEKGRFRTFLITVLRQFLADQRDRARAAKRGGGCSWVSLDDSACEEQFLEGLALSMSSEQHFDRQWAFTVMAQARERLHQEYVEAGKARLYDGVNLLNDGPQASAGYAALAREIQMTVPAVKSAVHRMRERYGKLVREEVARTVKDPADVDAELQHLLRVVLGL